MRTNRTAASSSDALRDFGPGASGLSCPPSVTYRRYVRNAMPSGGARQCAESVTKLTLRGRPALSSPRATNLSAELLVLATEQRKSSICPQGRASRWAWHGCLQFDRPPPPAVFARHILPPGIKSVEWRISRETDPAGSGQRAITALPRRRSFGSPCHGIPKGRNWPVLPVRGRLRRRSVAAAAWIGRRPRSAFAAAGNRRRCAGAEQPVADLNDDERKRGGSAAPSPVL